MTITAVQQPGLRLGKMAPIFALPSAQGGEYGPGALRSKYNMVLAFVGAGDGAESYLRSLAGVYASILEEQARVIAVSTAGMPEVRRIYTELSLPFPLLLDSDRALTLRMLGDPDVAALCVADRFGEIYFLETVPIATELPIVPTALEWLQFIQIQCPE